MNETVKKRVICFTLAIAADHQPQNPHCVDKIGGKGSKVKKLDSGLRFLTRQNRNFLRVYAH
jgi:hypothetical protein